MPGSREAHQEEEIRKVSLEHGAYFTPNEDEISPSGGTLYLPGYAEGPDGTFGRLPKTHAQITNETVWCVRDPKPGTTQTEEFAQLLEERKEHARAYYSAKNVDKEALDKALDQISLLHFQKAYNAIELIEEQNLSLQQVIMHSQGAVVGATAALLYPEHFERSKLVFVTPFGLTPPHEREAQSKSIQIAKGIAEKRKAAISRVWKDPRARKILGKFLQTIGKSSLILNLLKDYAMHIKPPNFLTAFEEASVLIDVDLVPTLSVLASAGMNINVMYGAEDTLNPPEEIEAALGAIKEEIKTTRIEGGHYSPVEDPEEFIKSLIGEDPESRQLAA